jgi:cytochrome c-type biogenesis protein CcmF
MIDLGAIAMRFALVMAIYASGISLLGGWQRRERLVHSAERAVYGVFGLVTVAMVVMLYALLTHDFSVQYVASVSNRSMPMFYLIASLWGGQEGSMLLWLWILAGYSALVMAQNRRRNRELMPYVIPALMITALLFIAMLVFSEDPFARLPQTPIDGRGLNPLLQHPLMVIHPPNLYLGFVGYVVPFAFAIGALVSGRLDNQWLRSVRRWTLVPWLFNTVGVLLGGQWAYVELGWGGYWAWDPVENASLMPWLTATAFLHSVMIQEKKGMEYGADYSDLRFDDLRHVSHPQRRGVLGTCICRILPGCLFFDLSGRGLGEFGGAGDQTLAAVAERSSSGVGPIAREQLFI